MSRAALPDPNPAKEPIVQLSSEASTLLRSAVRNHPNLPNLIDSQSALVEMSDEQIVEVASKLDLDITAVISATEKILPDLPHLTDDDAALEDYSDVHPGFTGHLAFDLELVLLGHLIKRKARLIYQHTPDWAYFDLVQKRVMFGWEQTKMRFEVLTSSDTGALRPHAARPETDEQAIEQWEEIEIPDPLFPDELWEATLNAIGEQSRQEDKQRRAKFNASV